MAVKTARDREAGSSDLSYYPQPGEGDLAELLFIRHFELALLSLFERGLISGTTHTCLGQEYIPVAVAPLLERDYVLSNHRGHGHYLARYRDPEGLLAEILGRSGAVCSGVGGSQHIWRAAYLSTGVQGQNVPIAVGVALSFRDSQEERLACVFVGDGTWGEGSVYEGLNLARLWNLPVAVLVEHNGIAQSTKTEDQMAGDIAGRASAFGIAYHRVDTDDISTIRAEVRPRLTKVRTSREPLVVEFRTRRLGPHSKGDDTRSADTVAALRAADWHARARAIDPVHFDRLEEQQRRRVDDLVAEVMSRPLSEWDRAHHG
jgi:acetoin:2,6-dichlorophenolindophenol oxidoreductase subunit alpha